METIFMHSYTPLTVFLSCCCSLPAVAGPPPNDECYAPEVVVGEGVFPFDNAGATTADGQPMVCNGIDGWVIENDIWFVWTSTCDGLVQISTCGLTDYDTRIAVYSEAGCPPSQDFMICCGDDECGKQNEIFCDVVCGRDYLIQLGGTNPAEFGSGLFAIQCMSDPCPDQPKPPTDCATCCANNPEYKEAEFQAFAGGQIAAFTRDSHAAYGGDSVLVLFDLSDEANAPLDTDWAPPSYASVDWSKGELGTVFGVTMNSAGEIFVAHSSVYGSSQLPTSDAIGALGSAGSIYRIDPVTAAPSVWASLPNLQDPSITPASEAWPGIGNITWDCFHGQMFATNMDDGRIYRLDSGGAIVETFDHASGIVVQGPTVEPTDAPGFAPLGERVWAVAATLDRLYYSIWGEQTNNPGQSNAIWSIGLDGSGGFVQGNATLEFEMPPLLGATSSNPVSDMIFTEDCCLIVAERSMTGPTTSGAHSARVLKFCLDVASGDWVSSIDTFEIGAYGNLTNASGGIAYDNGPDPWVWASGDALHWGTPYSDYIYGIQGLPVTGGVHEDAIMIDADQDVAQSEKWQMGSVEVTCWEGVTGGCIAEGELECMIDAAGGLSDDYALTLTITNNSGQDAHYLNIAGPVSNTSIPLPPLLDNDSITLDLTLYGPYAAGDVVCLYMTLLNADSDECCAMEVCMDIPECDCAIFEVLEVTCVKEGVYSFMLSFTNLYDPHTIEHLFFLNEDGAASVFMPEWLDIPSAAPFTKVVVGPITVTTPFVAGDTVSVDVSLHNEQLKECCVEELEFELPECDGGSGCPLDLNGDGVIDGADLGLMLANWGGTGIGDVDCDGDVDGADLGLLLAGWGPVGP
jgi:hypothetical protein